MSLITSTATTVATQAILTLIEKLKDKLDKTEDTSEKKDIEIEILQLQVKLKELEVQDYANKKGTAFEKVVTIVFPAMAYTFTFTILSNVLFTWWGMITKSEPYLVVVDDYLYIVIMMYVGGFFGYRGIGEFATSSLKKLRK